MFIGINRFFHTVSWTETLELARYFLVSFCQKAQISSDIIAGGSAATMLSHESVVVHSGCLGM